MIHGTLRGNQPAERQPRTAGRVGPLKPDARIGDVALNIELMAAEKRLQRVSNAEWQPSDGRDDVETVELQVFSKPGRKGNGRGMTAGHCSGKSDCSE
jgi:hypothetical protein